MHRTLAAVAVLLPSLAAAEPPFLPLVAHGTEPGWLLRAAEDGIILTLQLGVTLTGALPAPEPAQGGMRYAAKRVGFEIQPVICRDAMTGMPYPLTVTLLDADAGKGCGGDPLALMQGPWDILAATGTAAPEGAALAVEGRRLSGHTGCNRFSATMELSASGLLIGPAAASRKACAAPLMDFEHRLLSALTRVTRFDMAADGGLLLIEDETPLVTASR